MNLLPFVIIVFSGLGLLTPVLGGDAARRAVAGTSLVEWFWRGARWLYGGYFLFVAGMVATLLWFGGAGVHEPTPASKAFSDALNASGFMNPLLMVDYAFGGLALLWRRTAPLGLAILAPPVCVILLFHLQLTGNFVWGGGWALGWILLAWRYRAGFTGLWRFDDTSPART